MKSALNLARGVSKHPRQASRMAIRMSSSAVAGKTSRRYSAIAVGGLSTSASLYMSHEPARSDSQVGLNRRNDDAFGAKETQVVTEGAVQGASATRRAEDRGEDEPYLTLEEVAAHSSAHDAWVIVDGKVYDVTDFHHKHPGGSSVIVANAGRDVTELFRSIHPPNTSENNLPKESFKGLVDPEAVAASLQAYQAEIDRLEAAREALPDVETMLSLQEIEDTAKSFLSERTSNYYSGYSSDGFSVVENSSSFRKCRLSPRIMLDVTTARPQTTIFGVPSASPIYIAPASNALLGHPDGELNLTRGAAKTGIVQGVSAASSYPLRDILQEKAELDAASGNKMGMVYQVYVVPDRSKTVDLVKEAVAGGCQALVLTVDSNVGDSRQTTEKLKGTRGSAEPGIKMGPFTEGDGWHDTALNWDDSKWIKESAGDVPVYLKGVCHIEDVRLAKQHGLAGCILSNHGGRQLDRARTGFDSLRSIYAEDPQLCKETESYIDGGCRRGSEVLQALAMGAKGVGLGRPFLWAQAAYGEKGVIRAVRIMEDEIVTAMRLLGVRRIDEIKPGMVECLQEIWK